MRGFENTVSYFRSSSFTADPRLLATWQFQTPLFHLEFSGEAWKEVIDKFRLSFWRAFAATPNVAGMNSALISGCRSGGRRHKVLWWRREEGGNGERVVRWKRALHTGTKIMCEKVWRVNMNLAGNRRAGKSRVIYSSCSECWNVHLSFTRKCMKDMTKKKEKKKKQWRRSEFWNQNLWIYGEHENNWGCKRQWNSSYKLAK